MTHVYLQNQENTFTTYFPKQFKLPVQLNLKENTAAVVLMIQNDAPGHLNDPAALAWWELYWGLGSSKQWEDKQIRQEGDQKN